MGLSERQVLGRLEVPLAAPLILAGLRTSAVTVVATATLAGFAGGGGLGVFLYAGFTQQGQEQLLIGGAILVAVLSVLTEVLFAALERAVTPRTRSGRKARGPTREVAPRAAQSG
jgi:osmoprotectant transport system permease protein